MGREIAPGLDALTDSAQAITGSDAGWADTLTQIAAKLKGANNGLGSAAFADTGSSSGDVPILGSGGKIATSTIDTALAGGAAAAGKVPLLNAQGVLASSILGGSLGGAGLKYLWYYSVTGPGGEQPSDNESNLQDRYRGFPWRPRTNQSQADTYADCTAILVFLTGGGGSGAYGPPATGLGIGGTVPGHQMRKGGGGAAGSTAIRLITGITSASTYSVKIGIGGDTWTGGANATDRQRGGTSQFGSLMSAGGGGPGKPQGDGGQPTSGGAGDNRLGFYFFGGEGHDGTFDRLGAGAGGASFWGGGYSGGGGRGDAGRQTAPGAGGGAANGSLGLSPYTFTANASGKRGNDGCCLILGF